MKEYIPHPETVPLETMKVRKRFCVECHNDDETNGLSFVSCVKFKKNTVINLKMKIESELFEAYVRVAEIRNLPLGKYEIFVDFSKKIDPFEIKMIQQVCQIVDYGKKQEMKKNIAANDWISQNAKPFNDGCYNKKVKVRI